MNQITPAIYDGFEPWPVDLQGWHGDSSVFGHLIDEVRPSHIIEVGTWKGQSAINMANCVKVRQLDTKITCVDTWLGAGEFIGKYADTPERDLLQKHGYPQVYYQFLSNVVHMGHHDIILPLPAPSNIAAKVLKERGARAELIYIDGSHEPEDVFQDCHGYYKLLPKTGGIIFGDDYSGWPGLAATVHSFADYIGRRVDVVEDFWIIRT